MKINNKTCIHKNLCLDVRSFVVFGKAPLTNLLFLKLPHVQRHSDAFTSGDY